MRFLCGRGALLTAPPIDRKLAAKAFSRSHQGLRGKAAGVVLGVSTSDANQLADIGRVLEGRKKLPLTASEMQLLRTLAGEHRNLLDRGETRSPKSEDISLRVRRAPSWCAATVRKRLFCTRYEGKGRACRSVQGLGFVDFSGNGYINLTKAGWALVLAVEAAEQRERA